MMNIFILECGSKHPMTNQQIKCNLEHRAFNIVKYYSWLEINEMTPINIKMAVWTSSKFITK